MDNNVLITNDVETTSILNHRLRDKTAEFLVSQGMPRLLDLYGKYDIRVTFFFTGYVARLKPELVRMACERGHEIGSHGMVHTVAHAFDRLPFDTQVAHLKESKKILENISGQPVTSFRAPAARVDYHLPQALAAAGYRVDSSVSPQRLDMFLSFGGVKKLNWLMAPRKPYFVNQNNVFKKGRSDILEIPITALGFPYIGTFMRVSPGLNRVLRNVLYMETRLTRRPFTFLTHPNEFIDEDMEGGRIERRGGNFLSYLLGDVIRHKLKVRNLGAEALPILDRELEFFKVEGFTFKTCRQLYEQMRWHDAG